jgi:hypothetical protein
VVFDWEMEKWFHLRGGDEGFGLVDGRVGIWVCLVACSTEEKNWEI